MTSQPLVDDLVAGLPVAPEAAINIKLPLYLRLSASLACGLILVLGVAGNLLVALVVCRAKQLRNSTNLFLINLSVADLLVLLVCMPSALVELHSRPETWLLGEPMCKASNFVEALAANGSILTILAVGLERYYAICKPLTAYYRCTRARALSIIGLVWLGAAVASLPVLRMAKSSETIYIDGSLVQNCILDTGSGWLQAYVLGSVLVFFLLPLAVLSLLYVLIARRLMADSLELAQGAELGAPEVAASWGLFRPQLLAVACTEASSSLAGPSPCPSAGSVASCTSPRSSLITSVTVRRCWLRSWRRPSAPASSLNQQQQQQQQQQQLLVQPDRHSNQLPENSNGRQPRHSAVEFDSQPVVARRQLAAVAAVAASATKRQQMRSRRQVVKMLAFIVLCFFTLFLPYRAFTVWLALADDAQVRALGMDTYYCVTYASRVLIYLHSAINPIAYNLISSKFRRAFCCVLGFHRHQRRLQSSSSPPPLLSPSTRLQLACPTCAEQHHQHHKQTPPGPGRHSQGHLFA